MSEVFTTPQVNLERIKNFLSQGKRFDGRGLEEFRELVIETGVSKKAEGSARVKLGNTEVLVGVKMDVGTPYADSPNKGNFMVTAELLPLSSPRFENGKPTPESIEFGRVIDRGLRESGFLDFEGLCIEEGEKVWTVFVDIYTINDDGNLLDAAGIGAVAAMMNAKIPKLDEEGKVLYGEFTDKSLPLAKEAPIAISVHKIGANLIVDPTREEEDASETRILIGRSGEIISSMQKSFDKEVSAEEIGKALDITEKVYSEIFKKIKSQVK